MNKTLHKLTSCALAAALVTASVSGLPAATGKTAKAAAGEVTNSPARVSVHDPSIVEAVDGTYYAFGSHIDAAKTTDFINWQTFTNGYNTPSNTLFGDLAENLKVPFAWAGDHDMDALDSWNGYAVWAPDVFYNPEYVNADGSKGAYMMYFCTTSTNIRSVIAFGVSQNIEGPYEYVDSLIYSGFTKETAFDSNSNRTSKIDKKYTNTNIDELIEAGTLDGLSDNWFKANTNMYDNSLCPNAIDPTIYYDTEGKLWMTYGSWSGGIFTLPVDAATGRVIYPGKDGTKEVVGEDGKTYSLRVDKYFGTQISGGYTQSGEGPYILYDEESEYYYLYVSYEGLIATEGYQMRLFRSKNPDGPFLDAAGNHAVLSKNSTTEHLNAGIKVMGNYNFSANAIGYRAPGHNSALIDEDGSRYLIYHTRFDDSNGLVHQLRVHQQFLNEDNWPVTAVFENMGDKISETGYSTDEIVGAYEFINHGIGANKTIVMTPESITLNADGTITGDVSGTWKEQDNSYLATFVLDNVTYKGVFFKQYDEQPSRQQVMTFTAIGTNNMTVWGVKDDMFHIKSSKSAIYALGDTNNTAQVSAYSNNLTADSITYSSSDPDVAKVNSKTGKVTAVSADGGYTTITATIVCNGNTQELDIDVDVKEATISYTSKKTSLKVKKSATFKVKTQGIKAGSVKWKSSKTSVAKVSKAGKVTAKKAGTTKITAYYGKVKATVTLKVTK